MDVNVPFIDASTGQPIGHSVMPADQLPASFVAATTLHLADQQWQVEQAEPVTRAEFQQTGALRLTLRRIQHLRPDEILYSMPTICDELPAQVHPGPRAHGRLTNRLPVPELPVSRSSRPQPGPHDLSVVDAMSLHAGKARGFTAELGDEAGDCGAGLPAAGGGGEDAPCRGVVVQS